MPFLRFKKKKLLQALTFSKILLISWGYYWVLQNLSELMCQVF